MTPTHKEGIAKREHVHICTDLDGACLKAARHLVEETRLFRSYSELVRAAIAEYYRQICERELRTQALSGDTED